MFCIETGKLKLKLEVIPVESLAQHEETLPQLVNRLILGFKNWANLQNPIIVAENNIVLDGNHRVFVFKELKFRYIPVCKTDYFNENMKLRYWFRLLSNIKCVGLFKEIVEEMNGNFQQVKEKETLKKTLEKNNLHCGIQQGNLYAEVSFNKDIVNDAVSAYDVLAKIQDKLIQKGIKLKYIPCQYVNDREFCSELKDEEMVIWTPQITKEMVVDAVKDGKIFPPKTTRHIIPARPLNINVPTYWFKENILLEEINSKFSKFLEMKNLKRFGPCQVVDGRYYEEELFVFFDKK